MFEISVVINSMTIVFIAIVAFRRIYYLEKRIEVLEKKQKG